ncbi:MAG TPA: hypothetical protein DIU30_05845 [Clostridiales bacterium]|jgi:hypothetical protein|nr:hypothetical protein [Clostridium sp.]MEE1379306.1 hypothetical protein [Clostridia bacterium]CDE55022.1 uncharacterized protein conserved in bacteria [Clostridium sp. CAG:269]HCQ55847.1 hypothetical protein [Clostridiales bacterium]
MSKFVNEIKEICKKNKKVDMYIDMDGTIAEYHLYNPEEISRKMEEEYLKNEPLKNVIDVLEEISKINNIEMYILSLSKTKKITEKKKIWLKKYVPFIKEENWIILTKEIGEYSNENRNEIKGKNIELRQKDYDKSIMLDDEQVVLREAKKILNDKIEVFHISSALI